VSVAVSVEQFGKAVTSSQLLTADEVRAVWGTTPADERPKDGAGFARLLVAQKKLTEFQAAEILAGRGARLIMGEYSLLAEIGAGGMGQVYKAQHRRMKRVVALKVMSGAAMKDEAAVKRFQREVQAAARLEHPNIVTAYDSGEAGSVKYLVMQFVDGGDLSDLVKKTGPLPVEQAVGYVLQAAKGLAFAHNEGVIHRDIKPANLLLDKKGIIKILDMGLARIEGGDDGLTATEQVMGTVDYMSPEQAANTKTADARADIYSLGCTLWYLLTAKKVYDGDSMIGRLMAHRDAPLPSLVKTRDDVPWPLEQAFHKLIAKRPQDRFQSMDEVVAALEPFAGGGSSSSGSHSGSGSGSGNSAALASFMQAMGSNPAGPSGASSTQAKSPGSKTSVAAQLDATEQFDRLEVDTDPKSAVVPTSAGFTPTVGTSPKTSKPRPKNGRPPGTGNKTKLIAGGFIGAALLLVAGIIVKIRDKDGNVVAEVNAPSGVSAEVTPTAAAPKPPAATGPTPTALSFFAPGKNPRIPGKGPKKNKSSRASVPTGSTLPAGDASDEWQSLFNGLDLTGWTPQGHNGWTVVDGELVGRTSGTPGWLMTDAEYDDFELELEYKLSADSNSGVFFRAWPEGKVSGADFQEVQLLDDNSPKFNTLQGTTRTGAIFHYAAPSPEVRPPAGEWHTLRLAVFKDSARIWINEAQVVATELADGKRSRGRIGLQLYPSEVAFREIIIRELNSDGTPRKSAAALQSTPTTGGTPAGSSPGGGYTLRFDGNSLVEGPDVAWGQLRNFTIEAYALSDESGPNETSQFILDIYKHTSLHRYKGRWEFSAKYEGQALPEYARETNSSPVGRWDHLAGVVRDDAMHFYVNGKKVASKSFAKPRDTTLGNKLELGKRFLGSIREVRISKAPRYDADFIPRPRFEADADTLALYHCDEGTGNVLKDSSGRELHGKLVGATWVKAPVATPAPAAASSPSGTAIFNGTDLAGWTGKPGVWKWEAGELVGTLNMKDVTYLSGSNRHRDFELEYEVKLQGDQANAGAQFRSTLFDAAPFAMTGPQVEIGGGGKTGYGGLWWQSGPRNGVVAAAPPTTFEKLVKPDDYNRMTVRSVGKHVTISLNGTTTIDGDFDIPDEGLLGWQLVSQGEPATVRFRNIVFRDLSTGAPTTGAAAGPPIDLLAAIQIPRDVVAGGWQKQGAILSTTGGPNIGTGHNRLYLPTPGPVPAEYDLELDIERKSNSGTGFVVGFVMGGKQATAMIDSYGPSDHWGIDEIDGETLRGNANPTKNVKRRLIIDQPTKVRLEIRKAGVRVFCAAENVVDWQGRPEQLSTTFWSVPNAQSLFLGSQSTFHIRSIKLTPRAE